MKESKAKFHRELFGNNNILVQFHGSSYHLTSKNVPVSGQFCSSIYASTALNDPHFCKIFASLNETQLKNNLGFSKFLCSQIVLIAVMLEESSLLYRSCKRRQTKSLIFLVPEYIDSYTYLNCKRTIKVFFYRNFLPYVVSNNDNLFSLS